MTADEPDSMSRQLLEAQMHSSRDGILYTSPDRSRLVSNDAFRRIFAIAPAVPCNYDAYFNHVVAMLVDPKTFFSKVREFRHDPSFLVEEEVVLLDGRHIEIEGYPIRSADGEQLGRIWYFRDITDRKRTQEALLRDKELIKAITDNVPAGIAFLDNQLVLRRFNRIYGEMISRYGAIGPEEALGKLVSDVFRDRDAKLRPWLQAVRDEGHIVNHQNARLVMVGREREFETFWNATASPVHDPAGNVEGVALFLQDVTAQHHAQEAQRQAEASQHQTDDWLRLIMQHSLDGINVAEFDTKAYKRRLVMCNDRFVAMTGRNRKELMDCDDLNKLVKVDYAFPGQDRQHYECIVNGNPFSGRGSWIRPDGVENYYEWSASSLRMGEKIIILGIDRDITAQRQAQKSLLESQRKYRDLYEALRQSEARYRTLVETSPDGVVVMSLDGRLVMVNESIAAMFGYGSAQELLDSGVNAFDLVAPDDRPRAMRSPQTQNDVELANLEEYMLLRRDGSMFPAELSAATLEGDGEDAPHLMVLIRDITQRKASQEALQTNESQMRAILDTAQAIVIVLDGQWRIARLNSFARQLTGYDEEELLGRAWLDVLVCPQQRQQVAATLRQAMSGATPDETTVHVSVKDGRECSIRWRMSVMPAKDHAASSLLLIGTDVTDLRHKEEQLRNSQKLEAIGRLAGGIAHDFNNQLTVIQGYCDLLLGRGSAPPECSQALEEIRNAARRSASLTSQLLTFSRQQVLRPELIDLNDVLRDLANPLARMIGEDIALSIIPEPTLGAGRLDRAQVEQAVINLAVNARDAMPRGGRLVVETANVMLDREYTSQHVEAGIGPHVMLAVSDTGDGMDGETLKRVFEPFFTTKAVGKGTGLGLPMVYGFVKQSGGHITVSSRPGEGSTFRIYIPRLPREALSGAAQGATSPVDVRDARPTGTETIMVCEDSPPLRSLVCRILKGCGYHVIDAPLAPEALQMGNDHRGHIDLLITDVVMPQMSGPELARAIRAPRPRTKVLYITGYADSLLPSGDMLGQTAVLTKPFTAEKLAQTVRRMLDDQLNEQPDGNP